MPWTVAKTIPLIEIELDTSKNCYVPCNAWDKNKKTPPQRTIWANYPAAQNITQRKRAFKFPNYASLSLTIPNYISTMAKPEKYIGTCYVYIYISFCYNFSILVLTVERKTTINSPL